MGTQVLGEPRYPSLRGIMQARAKEDHRLVAGRPGHRCRDCWRRGGTKVLSADPPPQRGGATLIREAPDAAVAQVVDFLAARRLI